MGLRAAAALSETEPVFKRICSEAHKYQHSSATPKYVKYIQILKQLPQNTMTINDNDIKKRFDYSRPHPAEPLLHLAGQLSRPSDRFIEPGSTGRHLLQLPTELLRRRCFGGLSRVLMLRGQKRLFFTLSIQQAEHFEKRNLVFECVRMF